MPFPHRPKLVAIRDRQNEGKYARQDRHLLKLPLSPLRMSKEHQVYLGYHIRGTIHTAPGTATVITDPQSVKLRRESTDQ